MTLSKKTTLYISILAIFIYWLYNILFKLTPIVPSDFYSLVIRITILKVITFLVIFLLLKLEGDNYNELGFNSSGLGRQIGTGILFGLASWIFIHIVFNPMLNMVMHDATQKGT